MDIVKLVKTAYLSMSNLIDKSALVAEIERRVTEGEKVVKEIPSSAIFGLIQAYKNTLSFINTLEIKEVDLEKEYKDFVEEDPVYNKLVNGIVGKAIAKHFYALGLKAQKGE